MHFHFLKIFSIIIRSFLTTSLINAKLTIKWEVNYSNRVSFIDYNKGIDVSTTFLLQHANFLEGKLKKHVSMTTMIGNRTSYVATVLSF